MAAAPEEQSPDVEALIQRMAASRDQLGGHLAELRHKVDVPARIKGSVMGKPWLWFGGSLGAGFIASRVLRRPRKVKTNRKWLGFLLTTGFTILKPTLMRVVTSELQRRFMDHADAKQAGLPLSKR